MEGVGGKNFHFWMWIKVRSACCYFRYYHILLISEVEIGCPLFFFAIYPSHKLNEPFLVNVIS